MLFGESYFQRGLVNRIEYVHLRSHLTAGKFRLTAEKHEENIISFWILIAAMEDWLDADLRGCGRASWECHINEDVGRWTSVLGERRAADNTRDNFRAPAEYSLIYLELLAGPNTDRQFVHSSVMAARASDDAGITSQIMQSKTKNHTETVQAVNIARIRVSHFARNFSKESHEPLHVKRCARGCQRGGCVHALFASQSSSQGRSSSVCAYRSAQRAYSNSNSPHSFVCLCPSKCKAFIGMMGELWR